MSSLGRYSRTVRRAGLFLAVLLLPAVARPQAPSGVAPLYALPAEGTWVEYAWKATSQEAGETAGTLRISFVGHKDVQAVPYCWIELKRESVERGRTRRWVRKLLVARHALRAGLPLRGHVLEGYDRQGKAGARVTRLSGERLHDFLGLGFPELDAGLKVVGDKETAETRLGKFVARHVSAASKVRGRALEYHAWLTDRVPFGWARFEVREHLPARAVRTVFVIAAQRSGTGAPSELDESGVK
jgi:hypothetical protein